jgi:hypothetical protein
MSDLYKQKWDCLGQIILDIVDEVKKVQEIEPSTYMKFKEIILTVLTKYINKIDLDVTEQEAKIVDSNYIFDTYDVVRAKVFYDRKVGKLPVYDGTDSKSYRYRQVDVDEWAKQCKVNKLKAVDK